MNASVTENARRVGARVRENFRESIEIDMRSLALFRMLLGVLVVADVLSRSRNFWFYYAGEGAVPQSLAIEAAPSSAFSLFHFVSEPWQFAVLFGLHVLFGIQLIVGYKTRLATIISFLFVVSLDFHNPFVTSHADTLFRLLFFWAIFLPLGERWSIDAVHSSVSPRGSFTGIAAFFGMSQMVYMYFLNGYHKSTNELWTSGEATPLIMGIDEMTFFLGEYMGLFPTLLQAGGLMWYYMLLLSPLLILLIGRWRYPMILFFVGGHGMFMVTVRIGAFAYVAIAGLLLFLQPQFWRDLETVVRAVGIDVEKIGERTKRLAQVGEAVPRLRPTIPEIQALRAPVYNLAVGVVILSIVVFTLFTHTPVGAAAGDRVSPDEQIEAGATVLNIDQPQWSVFAPNPRTSDRYYVFAAETADGELIDIYNDGRALTDERPTDRLHTQHGAYRERFYMNSIRRAADDDRHDADEYLVDYLCQTWEEEHDQELTDVTIYTVTEQITMDTITDPDNRSSSTDRLETYACGDKQEQVVSIPS